MYYMSMRIHTHTFLIIRGEKTVFFIYLETFVRNIRILIIDNLFLNFLNHAMTVWFNFILKRNRSHHYAIVFLTL